MIGASSDSDGATCLAGTYLNKQRPNPDSDQI